MWSRGLCDNWHTHRGSYTRGRGGTILTTFMRQFLSPWISKQCEWHGESTAECLIESIIPRQPEGHHPRLFRGDQPGWKQTLLQRKLTDKYSQEKIGWWSDRGKGTEACFCQQKNEIRGKIRLDWKKVKSLLWGKKVKFIRYKVRIMRLKSKNDEIV